MFLSGISEITAVVDAAKEYSIKKNNWIVLPLHSTLSIIEQDKVYFFCDIILTNHFHIYYKRISKNSFFFSFLGI